MVDLKELKRLVKYLRKEGITEFKSDGLEFKLGSEPTKRQRKSKSTPEGQVDVSDQVNIESDMPSQKELLFWSAGGSADIPDEDPVENA